MTVTQTPSPSEAPTHAASVVPAAPAPAQRATRARRIDATAAELSVRRLPLDGILDRERNLRPLNVGHSLDLAESIAAVGLLQFIVVDEDNRLLAGGHRLHAIRLLREIADMNDAAVRELVARRAGSEAEVETRSDEEIAQLKTAFQRHFSEGVVVRVLATRGFADSEIHLQVEAIENEKRLDFSRHELAEIVERLRAAGYRDSVGKPRVGQRVLSQELQRIMGKSRRTVFRLLQELRTGEKPVERPRRDPAFEPLAAALTEQLGTTVRVLTGVNQTGQFVIHFRSDEHRAELLRRLRLEDASPAAGGEVA